MTTVAVHRGERAVPAPAERVLRWAGLVFGLVSAGFAIGYLVMGIVGRGGQHAEYPFVVNSVCKDALLALLCALLWADVRRFSWAATALSGAHLVLAATLGLMAVAGGPIADGHTWLAPGLGPHALLWVWAGADVLVAAAFAVLGHLAVRGRYDLRYLWPLPFRTLMAVAEVLVLADEREIAPAEVAGRVDRYLAAFTARDKYKAHLGLFGLGLLPIVPRLLPLPFMSPERRLEWLRTRFEQVAERRWSVIPRSIRRSLVKDGQQLAYMGYYSDERVADRLGYVPFSQREPAVARAAGNGHRRRVSCLGPGDVRADDMVADVLVVGTGAAGSILAYELAAQGREVLMLERGRHVDPGEFVEEEATQLSALYADGGLTLSRNFRFQVLQGMCVGGSTVVNNAVCLRLPDRVLDAWTDPDGLDCGLDPDELTAAFDHVERFLPVNPMTPGDKVNPGASRVQEGVEKLKLDRSPWRWGMARANVADCLGAGLCNVGCAYGRKLSALDHTLPLAQARFPGRVRVLAECRVDKVVMNGWRATGVEARLSDGRTLHIRADTVVLSAGALASSIVLQRSGLGEGLAGRRLAFNLATPVTYDFDECLHSDRGLEISHVLEPEEVGLEDTVYETWYQPLATMSLVMPGWFEDHRRNMERYRNMTCLGVVVGSKSTGSVSATRLGSGVSLDYTPDEDEMRRIKAGVEQAARIGFEAGARRVLPATFKLLELNSAREIPLIGQLIQDNSDLDVNSAHPQGGNPMCQDATRGVVDSSFRVYGTQNVYVCDASVFPSSITVNPQLTVMALAKVAADRIA